MAQLAYPWFTRGLPDAAPQAVRAEEVPTLDRAAGEDARDYVPDPHLSHAVNVALSLGMPLLLTGEPGTGKTQLASVVAHDLGIFPPLKFETKSTSQSKDLFYTYDALTAFKMKDATDPRTFIHYQALGRAILEAFPADDPRIAALLPPDQPGAWRHPGAPRRSVVLIDEIDKAPRDFPNDLLNEIERLSFRVPELSNAATPGANGGDAGPPARFRPIVIITSNSEKGLPDPFLRRCVYYDIPFPKPEAMRDIVAARIKPLGKGSIMLKDALDLFYSLRREQGARLNKQPSTAELLNWLQVLLHRGVRPEDSLRAQPDLVRETASALIKNAADRDKAFAGVQAWAEGRASQAKG
jgi:MoxR-like ATPase